jgi:deazaflavin-dependent oxidoreductase (nitroreductase family)
MPDKPQAPPPQWLMKAFIAAHVAVYRLSGGALGGKMGLGSVGLLSVRGRKSGKRLTVPLIYIDTDRGYAVIASRGGAPTNPAWYLNLKAAGEAMLTIGRRRIAVRVEEPAIGGDRYKALWAAAAAVYPEYDAYKAKTSRPIPVVELTPV